MIAVNEARQVVLNLCSVLTAELTSCEDMAGRVLAQDVVASESKVVSDNIAAKEEMAKAEKGVGKTKAPTASDPYVIPYERNTNISFKEFHNNIKFLLLNLSFIKLYLISW